jgi:hypothetical protein
VGRHTPRPWVFMTDDTFYGQIRDANDFRLIAVMPDMDDRPEDFALIQAAPDYHAVAQAIVAHDWAALVELAEEFNCLPARQGAGSAVEYEWQGDHEIDVRVVYPLRDALICACLEACIARAEDA